MNRQDAERIYEAGKEAVIEHLLEMDGHIHELQQAVARLTRNSTNSSKPPSSDPPGLKRTAIGTKPGIRKQGGQPGHTGKKRELLPAEEMNAIHHLYPQQCERCRNPLSQSLLDPTRQPLRHQIFELPKIVPEKIEFRQHWLRCSCGHSTLAPLPKKVVGSNFGPRLHAAIAYLTATHRVSRRGIAEIMASLFGIGISTGAVCKVNDRVSEACRPVFAAIKRYVASAALLNIDETGWKNKGSRRYLWCFVAPRAVLFHISPSRGANVLREILGETFPGIIASDDHSAYNSYHQHRLRQLCWAHLIRKFKALRDDRSSPQAYCFAKNMLREIGKIFAYWHAFPQSGRTRQQLWMDTAPMRQQMREYCEIFLVSSDPLVKTRAKRTLANWQHLFTFIKCPAVEPTNNRAERAIRPAVQWRKLCFGSQSDSGERFVERLLSVTATCRLHGVNPFEFLTKVLSSASAGEQPPQLRLTSPT